MGQDGSLYAETIDGFTTLMPFGMCSKCGQIGHNVLSCQELEANYSWVANGLHRPKRLTTILDEYHLQRERYGRRIAPN